MHASLKVLPMYSISVIQILSGMIFIIRALFSVCRVIPKSGCQYFTPKHPKKNAEASVWMFILADVWRWFYYNSTTFFVYISSVTLIFFLLPLLDSFLCYLWIWNADFSVFNFLFQRMWLQFLLIAPVERVAEEEGGCKACTSYLVRPVCHGGCWIMGLWN